MTCQCVCGCEDRANEPYVLCFTCYRVWHAEEYGLAQATQKDRSAARGES